MHSLCCFNTLLWQSLSLRGLSQSISLCSGARWAIPTHRARLELHKDLFQDVCVNHNSFDADNEAVTRIRAPCSKSSAEGNGVHNHEFMQSYSLSGYCGLCGLLQPISSSACFPLRLLTFKYFLFFVILDCRAGYIGYLLYYWHKYWASCIRSAVLLVSTAPWTSCSAFSLSNSSCSTRAWSLSFTDS